MSDLDLTVFDNTPCAIAMLDSAGVILRHNREFAKRLGRPPEQDFVRTDCGALWTFDTRAGFDAFLGQIAAEAVAPRNCIVSSEHDGTTTELCLLGQRLDRRAGTGQVLLVADRRVQFDVRAVNGIFAAGFDNQLAAAMIIVARQTLAGSQVIAANQMASTLHGLARGDMIGRQVHEFTDRAISDDIRRGAETAFAEQRSFSTTYVRALAGGVYETVQWDLWPVHDSNGGPAYWADRRWVVTDETSTAEETRKQNQLLSQALAASELGIWQWDLASNDIAMSQRLLKSLGYTPEDIGDPNEFNEGLFHPDDRHLVEASIRNAIERGQHFEYVARLRSVSGEFRPIRVRGQAIMGPDGRPTRLVGTETDATEEYLLRDRLLRAERIAKIGHWIMTLEPPGFIWSPEVFRLHGLDPAEFTPTPDNISSLMHPEDRQLVAEGIERTVGRGQMNMGDHDTIRARIVRPDGEIRHCEFTAVIDRDETGRITGLSGTVQDISELMITQESLLRSQKMEVVGHIAGGVAHDFNNLLAVIMGNLELLQETDDPAERAEFITAALAATRRGAETTRDLLSFARKATLNPRRLNVNASIEAVINLIRRVMPGSIAIETRFDLKTWTTHADRTSFENAILNLAINARDAMPRGGTLTIETSNKVLHEVYRDSGMEDLHPGAYVVVAVSDTGEGIPDDLISEIFTPFFSTKPDRGGSGLGLSMVQGFTRQSGGGVRVYSETGIGTTVKLFFPASHLASDFDSVAPRQSSVERLTGRVLFVEDDEAVSRVMARRLTEAGLECVVAHNGDEAIALHTSQGPFDLLLSDIVLPGTYQGPLLARELRQRQPDLKVVYISGYPNEATIHGNGLQPDDVRLMKPVSKAELLAALAKSLNADDEPT